MMLRQIIVFLFLSVVNISSAQDEVTPEDQEYFINQIFNLYGDTNHLSFEGFEHLMENLGLGGLKFEKSHNLSMHKVPDGRFLEVHDELNLHVHNHSRHERSVTIKSLKERCLSPETLLSLYGLKPGHRVSISHEGFMRICPAIVYQLDRRACAPPEILRFSRIPPSASFQTWIAASVSIFVISISGLIGVAVVPFLERAVFRRLLSTLVALAVGTLCGDALIHLLPHAYGMEDDRTATMRSTATFLSIMGFFVIEAIINHKQHKHGKKKPKSTTSPKEKDSNGKSKNGCYKHVHDYDRDLQSSQGSVEEGIGSVAWMVVSGDGLHNLTDGLVVGAAFRADMVSGLATAVAVLTHEFPHELGDFAVLLKAGMTVKQAIFYNIVSSVLSFIGMVFGVLLGNIESATQWIYCATAGSFLYIGLADLIPELHKYRKKGDAIANLLLQLLGMFIGAGIMFLIALYEHSLHNLFSHN